MNKQTDIKNISIFYIFKLMQNKDTLLFNTTILEYKLNNLYKCLSNN